MSSSKQSRTSEADWYVAVTILVVILVLRYESQIMQAVKALFIVVIVGMLVSGVGWLLYQHRKRAPIIHAPGGCDVDLTDIEDDEFEWWEEECDDRSRKVKSPPEPPTQSKTRSFKTEFKPDPLLDSPLHRADTLTQVQAHTLELAGYHKQDFVPIGESRRRSFYIRSEGGERLEHMFIVQNIIGLLKGKVEITPSKPPMEPDVMFWCNRKYYALEVETPLRTRQKLRLRDMAKRNTARFGVNWAIVVTKSAYAKQFQQYQQALTRNQVNTWIEEIIG